MEDGLNNRKKYYRDLGRIDSWLSRMLDVSHNLAEDTKPILMITDGPNHFYGDVGKIKTGFEGVLNMLRRGGYSNYRIAYNNQWVTDNKRFFEILLESKYEPEHEQLKESGMFWEFYPELSGDWEKDKDSFIEQLELTRNNGA